jgi:ABC-2 type transport system permease protein
VLRLLRRAHAIFKAYLLASLIRSRGLVYALLGFGLWMILIVAPISLFAEEGVDTSTIASRVFVGIILFYYFSFATWEWGAELRWMIMRGILEYYIASGSGFAPHYLAILPVTLLWLAIALSISYALLSILWSPPVIVVYDYPTLIAGFAMYTIGLLGYALILGGSMITTGAAGFFVDILSFILPIATGGLFPLRYMPDLLRSIALATPFSYPAELIRYALLGVEPVLQLEEAVVIGAMYNTTLLLAGILLFKHQLKRALRQGFPSISLW